MVGSAKPESNVTSHLFLLFFWGGWWRNINYLKACSLILFSSSSSTISPRTRRRRLERNIVCLEGVEEEERNVLSMGRRGRGRRKSCMLR